MLHAKLIKHKSSNGYFQVEDNIPLGKLYYILEGSVREETLYNVHARKKFKAWLVTLDDGTWFPLELLEMDKAEVN